MAVKLSPIFNEQQFDANGDPLVGGKLYTYVAGSSTPLASYTSITGLTAQANPIILNSRGEVDNPIWLTTGQTYKFALYDVNDVLVRTVDNVTGVNDSSVSIDQWVNSGITPTYVSATQFTLAGDQTSTFEVGRRIKASVTSGTVYGTIIASVFTSLTTVTVSLDNAAIFDTGLTAVFYGILTKSNSSIPFFNISSVSFKNKIIGGDFTTNPWQRGTSFAAIGNEVYAADRWLYNFVGTGVVSVIKTADAPTASEAGLYTAHCLDVDVTTADTAIAIDDVYAIKQRIEGFNAASFGFGQVGSRFVTLSFWVKNSKTGINCVFLRNSANNRSYVAEYTINAINTWEKKVIKIPVDNAGTWIYENGVGLKVGFTLSSGTNFQTTANTWAAGNFYATANQVNNLDNIANNFKIALVQLEAGSTATAFETRSFGQELALCQRYFYAVNNAYSWSWYGEAAGRGTPVWHNLPVTMRATPTTTSAYSAGVNTGTPTFNLSATQFYAFIGTAAAGGASATLTISTFNAEL